jgi:hypothetical protein
MNLINAYRKLVVRAHRTLMFRDDIQFYFWVEEKLPNSEPSVMIGRPLGFEKIDPTIASPEVPTFTLDLDTAQQLMDELWQVGLRPSEGTGSAGSLAATQKHLEDMRKLVFEALTVEVK